MERNREFRELVQKEKEKLENEEIFESAFYRQMLLSVAREMTGGTLKRVELVKKPEETWAGVCGTDGVRLNLENVLTASFPTLPLKSDSLFGILGHECGHWNFSDFGLRGKYLEGLRKGEWYRISPQPKTKEEEEHLKEINGYFKGKHIPALTLLSEMASFVQNMLEDAYVERKMCKMYPGSIRRGILQNRVRRAERIPSLKVQLESGYDSAAILLNLMTQYSLLGTVNNWEGETGELLSLLETVKPVIDLAADVESAEIRMAAVNRILLVIWKVLAEKIRKMEKQQQERQQEKQQEQPSDGKEKQQEKQERPADGQEQQECQDGSSDGKEKQQERQDGMSDGQEEQQERQDGSSDGKEKQQERQDGSPDGKEKQQERQDESSDGKEKQQERQDGSPDGKEKQQERQDESSDEKQNQQKQQDESQSGSSDGQENQNVLEEMMEEFQGQLPEYLLERDSKDAAGKPQNTLSGKAGSSQMEISRLTECEFETGELLMEHIQGLAEENAKKELDKKICTELLGELSETAFDGDHQKVKKVLIRETENRPEAMERYQFYEKEVKSIMRRMKPRLLPVLSCQRSQMERKLFFGSRMDYQALYDPGGRIFQNMDIVRKVDTAVALLIDLSDSMHGERIHQARLCALCLYEFCTSVDIPVLIYGHYIDGKHRCVQDETVFFHSFAEFDADRGDRYRIASMETGGCNRDGAALCFVGEKLAKRPEKIRLLFVISDGFPNATRYNGKKAEEDMLRIKESLERKRITVLTAAIGSDKEQIQRIYKEGFLDISDIGQLPYVLPKQVLMRIRR
jgi:cobalamin biosynthesis protein CobT